MIWWHRMSNHNIDDKVASVIVPAQERGEDGANAVRLNGRAVLALQGNGTEP